MTNLTENILQKIKADHIHPAPKKFFLLKRGLAWFLSVLSLLISLPITAIIIDFIVNLDWDIASRFTTFKPLFIFLALPYFWFVLLIIFSGSLYYHYRHTKYGYRLKFSTLIAIFIILNFTFGLIAHQFNWGHQLEEKFGEKISAYNYLNNNNFIWSATNKGLLAGKILAVYQNKITIADLQNNIWQILFDKNISPLPNVGEKIKIIGQKIGEREFFATQIRPWCGCNKCLSGNNSCNINLNTNTNNSCAGNCDH